MCRYCTEAWSVPGHLSLLNPPLVVITNPKTTLLSQSPVITIGAGNSVNPNGLKTHYLWEEILTKDSLGNIIDKFAQVVEEKDEEIKKTKLLILISQNQPNVE